MMIAILIIPAFILIVLDTLWFINVINKTNAARKLGNYSNADEDQWIILNIYGWLLFGVVQELIKIYILN